MEQDFRTGKLDVLTAGELSKALHHHRLTWFQEAELYRLKGLRVTKLPRITTTATAASFTLNQPPGESPCGPESGFIWLLRRMVVASSVAGDTAIWQGYGGSDFSAVPAYLLDQGPFTGAGFSPTYSTFVPAAVGPAAPVSATLYPNTNQFPVTVTLTTTGGITAVNLGITGPAASTTPLPAGVFSFVVPAGGVYSVTWATTQPTATTTAAPGFTQTVVFNATAAKQGFNMGQAYYPGNKAAWVFPDEQLYATVTGATVNAQYTITGIALEVPAEMQGKLVG